MKPLFELQFGKRTFTIKSSDALIDLISLAYRRLNVVKGLSVTASGADLKISLNLMQHDAQQESERIKRTESGSTRPEAFARGARFFQAVMATIDVSREYELGLEDLALLERIRTQGAPCNGPGLTATERLNV